ncbi:hypothetical protein JNB71_15860 [Rhizobium herbae]|uniref:GcrA cell cycle regulator n=1 Tax=Rhizobium herbae TaxID=508661 RepID=A0ABS7HEU0_9HYPH|nr:hypothetical protein [Rhizobium herbae]
METANARPNLKKEEHAAAEPALKFLTLLELGPSSCRWPVNSPAPRSLYLFCGSPTDGQKPYCKLHCEIAYRPNVRKQSATRQET